MAEKKRWCVQCGEREASVQVWTPWHQRFEDMCEREDCWFRCPAEPDVSTQVVGGPPVSKRGPVRVYLEEKGMMISRDRPGEGLGLPSTERRNVIVTPEYYHVFLQQKDGTVLDVDSMLVRPEKKEAETQTDEAPTSS